MRRSAALLLLLAAAPALAEEEVGVGLPAPAFSLKALNADVTGSPWFRLDQFVGEEADDPEVGGQISHGPVLVGNCRDGADCSLWIAPPSTAQRCVGSVET